MANYARVKTKYKLDREEIDANIRQLVKGRFGGTMDVHITPLDKRSHFDRYGYWTVLHPKDNYCGLRIWIEDELEYGKEVNGQWTEHKKPKVIRKQSVIVFEHGHSYGPMWFAEGVIRECFGVLYDARMEDDGVSGEWAPKMEDYKSFDTYVASMTKWWTGENPALKGVSKEIIAGRRELHEKECYRGASRMPQDLVKALGVDPSKDPDIQLMKEIKKKKRK